MSPSDDAPLSPGVNPGSPAEVAGIRPTTRSQSGGLVVGDIITAVGGAPTPQVEDLMSVVEERQIGEAVDVELLRGAGTAVAEAMTLRVQLEEREQPSPIRSRM